nr:uncharacterized protein LOC112012316 isoform X2 [Quercus suber]
MASTCVTGFLVVLLVLQPWITLSYLLPPVFSPVYDDVCKEVVCGKGTCKPSNQSAFLLFECECYPGWKQANFGLADNKFLPCVVPDCTINYSCMNAFSPVQDKGSRANESIFDRAIGMDCSTLGISSSNKPTSVTQVLYDDGMNHATSILQGHSLWLITLMTFMAMVQWK